MGPDLRDLLGRSESMLLSPGHQPGMGLVLVGDVYRSMPSDGDARIPAGAAIFVQGLDEPFGAVEPGVLQVPVLPVVVCDVRPVRAVDGDGDRGSDVVAALVVDVGLRP